MNNQIECHTHGKSECTYVCPHILQTLDDNLPRGFNWTLDDEEEIQAFCNLCWYASDEEWKELSEEGCILLCLECLKRAASTNGVEMEIPKRLP